MRPSTVASRPASRASVEAFAPPPQITRPLRVAIVSEYYYPHLGGVTEHVHYLSRELRRLGHHVDIITSHLGNGRAPDHVIRLGQSVPVFGNLSMARVTVGRRLRERMRELLRESAYDLVHVHCPLNPTLPLTAIEVAEVPLVGTFHTSFPSSLGYRFGRQYFQGLLDRLDVAIAVSQAAVDAHAKYFEADWRVIPNGIDVREFHPDIPAPVVMRDGSPTILFVGRFDPRNALGTLIAAFDQVQREHRDARLVVVGDGPLRAYYRFLAGANSRIHFAGALTSERAAYYAGATVYACPTTRASFGVTLLEAMAAGTPIVCSDLPGFRSVVTHEQHALLSPVGDVDSLAKELMRVLSDDALRVALGARGIERARTFSWPRVAKEVLRAYQDAGVAQVAVA